MIFDREDLDFIEGFVKKAYETGADENLTAALLAVAYPQWKMRTTGREAEDLIIKQAGPVLKNLGVAAKGLGSFFGGTGKALGHGAANTYTGLKGVAKRPSAWIAGGRALGGYGAYKGVDAIRERMNRSINMDAFGPAGSGEGSGNYQGASGDGSIPYSSYSPHGAHLMSRLNAADADYASEPDPSIAPPNTPAAHPAAGATQWDREARSGLDSIRSSRNRMKSLQDQLAGVQANGGLNQVERYQQTANINRQIASEKANMSMIENNLSRVQEQLREKEAIRQQAIPTAKAKVADRLNALNSDAEQWAKRQQQAADASWWGPRAFYKTRNWLTGDTEEYGNQLNQKLQGAQNLKQRLNSLPEHYYFNYP